MKKTSTKTSKKQTEKSKSSPEVSSKTTEPKAFDLWQFVNSLSKNKKYLFSEDTEAVYDPWTINKAFSFYVDTIYEANDMNRYHQLPKRLQHDFLINSIRSQSRYEKWVKPDKDSDEFKAIAAIREHYHFNTEKAKAALSILTDEQVAIIITKIEKGGIAK